MFGAVLPDRTLDGDIHRLADAVTSMTSDMGAGVALGQQVSF